MAVYCGARLGQDPVYADAARALGARLACRGLGLVYGGGRVGLMGVLADAVLEAGGEAIGVIPEFMMAREVAHDGLTALHVVDSMHARKARMAALADAFVALPGGLGTLDELVEMLTWAQLGLHAKPCGLLNVRGYFDGLLAFVDHAAREGFVRPGHHALLTPDDDPERLLTALLP